jgi:hypothetical protein
MNVEMLPQEVQGVKCPFASYISKIAIEVLIMLGYRSLHYLKDYISQTKDVEDNSYI